MPWEGRHFSLHGVSLRGRWIIGCMRRRTRRLWKGVIIVVAGVFSALINQKKGGLKNRVTQYSSQNRNL